MGDSFRDEVDALAAQHLRAAQEARREETPVRKRASPDLDPTTTTTIRLSRDTKRRVAELAARERRSMARQLGVLVEAGLKAREPDMTTLVEHGLELGIPDFLDELIARGETEMPGFSARVNELMAARVAAREKT